jgi:hypothetical protein
MVIKLSKIDRHLVNQNKYFQNDLKVEEKLEYIVLLK